MNQYERIRQHKENSEAVAVNHRALITRTLTKYPVDYALYRELLQNSADARAETATIQFFSTNPSAYASDISQIHTVPIKKMMFSNDGAEFSMDDWNRLKEIARGNPNETKIGAFGVGFYSVFELTDEPLVHSGSRIIAFHYQGDQLQYNWADAEHTVKGTTIDLPYRNFGTIPDMVKFTAFIVQSLVLVPLNRVILKVDNTVLLEITKQSSTPCDQPLPSTLNAKSPNGTLKLASMSTTPFQIGIEYLNVTQMPPISMSSGFFSIGKHLVKSLLTKSDDPSERTKIVCFLRRTDATIKVGVSSSFRKKMIDTVMKAPPAVSTMSLLSFSKEEFENSDIKPPLSDYIFPTEFNDAKIFIGFPTKQSTGFKSHLALNQVVPTMERTAVDMSNAFVKDWNSELLYMAGMLARCVYENELSVLQQTSVSHQLQAAKYTMQRFQFGESAPDQLVGACISTGFWNCDKVMLLPTAKGIMPSTQVRFAGEFEPLLRHIPIIKSNLENKKFVHHLVQAGHVRKVSFAEVIADLRSEPVSPELLKAVTSWIEAHKNLSGSDFKELKAALKVKLGDGRIQSLDTAIFYQDAYLIDRDLPVPESCIPADVVEILGTSRLLTLGIAKLPITVWTEFIAMNPKLLEKYADELLATLDRAWHRLHNDDQNEIINALSNCKCVSTNQGKKAPGEAYITKIPLFPSLAIVNDSVRASRSFLATLGVRESVDMAFVLEALHNSSSGFEWSTQDLVDYLVDNSSALKADDWVMLRQGPFYRERESQKLVKIQSLYAPVKELIKLGFPVLDWTRPWELNTPAGRLLSKLGIRTEPDATELFSKALEKNLVPTAMTFFLANYSNAATWRDLWNADLPIIPGNNGNCRPSECFVDSESAYFGYSVLADKYTPYASKLGVQQRASMDSLLGYLLDHRPRTMAEGDTMFAYLSKRSGEIHSNHIAMCASKAFIPVRPKENVYATPSEVYLNSSEAGDMKDLFYFVDALPTSVPFLLKIGLKQSPTLIEIAQQTVARPEKVFGMINDADRYLALLARFHYGWKDLSRDKNLLRMMSTAPFLLALKHSPSDESDERDEGIACLSSASEIAIVDDIMIFNLFKHDILTAPQESTVEQFYERLGSQPISQLLQEACKLGNAVEFKDRLNVQNHIRERLRLFLESTSKPCRIRPSDVEKFTVEFVSSIQICRKLRKTRQIESLTTALMHPNDPKKLMLTPNFSWFDASQALTKAVAQKPDPESVIVLELQLSTDLKTLQQKGYNVNRILNKKKKMEVEIPPPRSIEAPPATPPVSTPAKPQVPVQPPAPHTANEKDPSYDPVSRPQPGPSVRSNKPPPYEAPSNTGSDRGTFGKLKSLLSGKSESKPEHRGVQEEHTAKVPTKPGSERNLLRQAILDCQPYNAAQLKSPDHVDKPVDTVNTCRENGTKDLRLALRLDEEISFFVKTGAAAPTLDQLESARRFKHILKTCSAIYECNFNSFNLYIGEMSSIAFNFNGSLFFNLAVFTSQVQGPSWQPAVVLDYWYTVVAHELAHNLVSSHGAQHSFFSESYVQTYLSRLRAQRLPESAPLY